MAASTITRDTWTNDSGTAASPAADGTVLNNAALQNNIYARIDAMFAGAGAYATFALGGLFSAEGFGTHLFSAGGTGGNEVRVRNTSAGTGNYSSVVIGNDGSAGAAELTMLSSTWTTTSIFTQDGLTLACNRAGGISVAANHASGAIRFYAGGTTERARLTTDGILAIGDTTNASMTQGITINQGAALNEILALKQSGVAHGITAFAETDTFCAMRLLSTDGGVKHYCLSAGTEALAVTAIATTESTTKSTGADATIYFSCQTKSGTTGTAMGANANMVVFTNQGSARFILDADGDSHQDVGTAWTNFDDHEDADLLTAFSAGVSREDDPLRVGFGSLLEQHRGTLERSRIVTFNEDGHHFVNWSRLNMLKVGAIRQSAARIVAMGQEIADLKRRLLALEA